MPVRTVAVTSLAKRKWLVGFVAAIGFIIWNIAWPMHAYILAHRSRTIHSQEFSGEFSGVFAMEIDIGSDGNYVNTPFSRMPGECTRLKLFISPEMVELTTTWGNGYEFTETYALGKNIVYLGNDRFVFYSTHLNFGQILPGTIFATTECLVEVSSEALSISAVENQIGMCCFLVPVFQRTTFIKTYPSFGNEILAQ